MRLIEVARALGMTGQKLRHELAEVDFGVKPTDREVPDQIAQGIIRYIANKYGIEVKEVEEEEVQEEDAGGVKKDSKESDDSEESEEVVTEKKAEEAVGDDGKKLHVLRKLTLDDVSDAAARAHAARPAARRPARRRPAVARAPKKKRHAVQEQIKKKEGVVELPEGITVKEFAEKTGVQVPEIISVLMKNGVMASINQNIDFDTAAIVAEEVGVQVRKEQVSVSAESLLAGNLAELLKEEETAILTPRPPIVTVMGHVDHGKTAILDAVRKTDVASGEAGGITQSIGATQVQHEGKLVTFLDTPGHEAFTSMRARGAQITDVVILVIAADEGIKPTTIEAIDHAKEAGVPILVALNKMDREGADPDRVKGELAQHDLQPEDWGGKIPVVPCSAKTGQGINDLMDAVLIVSEMEEFKANADRPAVATVIESHLDSSLGPVASIIVNTGTLRLGENVVCGETSGRIKSMVDSHGDRQETVSPSGAVRIAGLSVVPETGDILQVVKDEQEAKRVHQQIREARERDRKRGLGDLISRLSEGKMQSLKIVLKADSQGEIEALQSSLSKLKNQEGKTDVIPKVIHAAVGNVSETDVMMAAASDGIVIGFNVVLPSRVEEIAQKNGVQVKLYDVIYELLDDVTSLLAGLIEPEEEEKVLGHLEVRGHFFRKRNDQVIGGKVTDGLLKRTPFRLMRDGDEVGTGRITNLKHVEKDVKEAKEGREYGLRVECATDIQEGDVLESYVQEFKKRG
jgi:translation initiation factor IF-2